MRDRDEEVREWARDTLNEVSELWNLKFAVDERAEVHRSFNGVYVSVILWVPEPDAAE